MNNAKETGMGFCGTLILIFITLKLCHVITWAWIWVLAPIWLPIAIILGILAAMYGIGAVLLLIIAAIDICKKKFKGKNEN